MMYEDQQRINSENDRRVADRARKRLRRAGNTDSPTARLEAGTVPAVANLRAAFIDGLNTDNLPLDEVKVIDKINREHMALGRGMVEMMREAFLKPEIFERILAQMSPRDMLSFLEVGVKLERSAMAAMGNRNPTKDEDGNRKELAGRVLKDISLLDKLHALAVDDEVDEADLGIGIVVDVRTKQEIVDAENIVVVQPHQEQPAAIKSVKVIKKK